jgi:hypothetical protein
LLLLFRLDVSSSSWCQLGIHRPLPLFSMLVIGRRGPLWARETARENGPVPLFSMLVTFGATRALHERTKWCEKRSVDAGVQTLRR